MMKYCWKTQRFIVFIAIIFTFVSGCLTGSVPPEIEKLENGLLPPVIIEGRQASWTLAERMKFHKVPGVSIAVVKDFKVAWTRGFGVTDMGAPSPVTGETMFQAASLSKPVTALAVLRLAQDGKFKLDGNVNDYLKKWKLPDSDFTRQVKVTPKHLLSHSGGTTVPGFRGYAAGEAVPTLFQVLSGKPPANSAAIVVDAVPGMQSRYSGGGYCILQQLLIDTENKPFPEIMETLVLKPLGMTHSTFSQPLPPDRAKFAASGHLANGRLLPGKWHTYPEMAAAGLWTTSEDLSRVIVDLQLALKNKSDKVLSQKTARLMLTPYVSDAAGLGIVISKKKDQLYFLHNGSNEGFRCIMTGHMEDGYGAAVMTNSDQGHKLYYEILRGIANIYKWKNYLPPAYDVYKMSPKKQKALTGKYKIDSDHLLEVTEENGRLYARVTFSDIVEIAPIGKNKCLRTDAAVEYEFAADPGNGQILRVIRRKGDQEKVYERQADDFIVPGELLMRGELGKAMEGYRKLKEQNPFDPMINGFRLLNLAHFLMQQFKVQETLALLDLVADLHPQVIKNLRLTLNTELKRVLSNPAVPRPMKDQVKEGYNRIMRKLQLQEIE
jgi:CubicO group peptidase (beta-lactamase class C family)